MSTWLPAAASYLSSSPVTSLHFDFLQDLVWSGNSQGYVSSWFTTGNDPADALTSYTSYKAHKLSATHQILANDRGILSLGMTSIKLANRRGLYQWSYQEKDSTFSSMAHSPIKNSEVVVASSSLALATIRRSSHELILLNIATGTFLKRIGITSPTSHLQTSQNFLCCGQVDGSIVLRDPRDFKVSRSFLAHSGGISALEVAGTTVYSLGCTMRQGIPTMDTNVKIFDIRAMKPLSPIFLNFAPGFLKANPKKSDQLYIGSVAGLWAVVNAADPENVYLDQVETGSCLTAMDLSPTGDFLAFGDAEGTISLWTNRGSNSSLYAGEICLPHVPEVTPKIRWTDDIPLSAIPMPEHLTPLLSDFNPRQMQTPYSFRPSPQIDPEILASVKTVDGVKYASLPQRQVRNQVPRLDEDSKGSRRKLAVPLFRSEKRRDPSISGSGSSGVNDVDETMDVNIVRKNIPAYYNKVEIKYSKFGVEDFDFGFYNKTKLSGLETHVVNSYVNSILQVLRFMTPFRLVAESHIAEYCSRNGCLLCELGFLFKMLKDANGQNCQASNFSRAFTANSQAGAYGLLDIDEAASSNMPYSSLIQLFNRFLVETVSLECEVTKPEKYCLNRAMVHMQTLPSVVKQLFEITAQTTETCQSCGNKAFRDSSALVTDLIYPRMSLPNEPVLDFPSILQRSINRESVGNTTCTNCRRFSHQQSKRSVSSNLLPPILSINSGVQSPDQLELWLDHPQRGRFLQPRVEFYRHGDSIAVRHASQTQGNVVYDLKAIVFQVQTKEEPAHLVAAIKVPTDADTGTQKDSWFLFNDFLVHPITEEEALSFSGTWKIPSTLYFQRMDCDILLDFSTLPTRINPSILFHDQSTSRFRETRQHRVLRPDELPVKGTKIAIDAEFVSLQQEEVECFSDGSKLVLRPARMSLARVSVLRGEGPLKGTPFIDDYIETTEDIVDYLTEYSGIRAGDLDRHLSKKSLVPIKTAYKKLRVLLDIGCVFVGHGLSKDLRIINIFIPPEQIIDTVIIYHLPHRHRRISLRFLAWYMLGQTIQSEGVHDSIEDARTALKLYEHYQNAIKMNDDESSWEEIMEGIYSEGKSLNWRVPGIVDKHPPPPPPQSPPPLTSPNANNILYSPTYHRNTGFHLSNQNLSNIFSQLSTTGGTSNRRFGRPRYTEQRSPPMSPPPFARSPPTHRGGYYWTSG